jgi:hypothetical protein
MITTDTAVSKKIGKSILTIIVKQKKHGQSAQDIEYERLLLFVHTAIHHQINFDFLEEKLRSIPVERFNPAALSSITTEEMEGLLKDYQKPERILAEERAAIVREFCSTLTAEFEGKISKLLEESFHSVIRLRNNLDVFSAFSEDPLRKKSNILIQMLSRRKLADFSDTDNINPAIDYHLVRLLLRNGRTKIDDEKLMKKIIAQKRITNKEDELIRKETAKAFRISAKEGLKTIPLENWIEWNIARKFCVRDEPLCVTVENPLKDVLEFGFNGKCPLYDACEKRKEYKREPVFKTSFY